MSGANIVQFAGDGQPPTMNSREIAELTGKRHDHVMRDVRKMLIDLHGEEALPKFGGSYIGQDNTERPCFNLPKRESLILVSGYDVHMRAAIIDRWQTLEDRRSPEAMLSNPSSLRALLLENVEKVIALESKVQADAPKVAFAEQVEGAPDAIPISQAAKILDTGRNRLAAKMREWRWITRMNEPYQDKINAGLLDVKIGSWEHPEKGLQRSVTAMVTGKGLAKLHQLFGRPSASH